MRKQPAEYGGDRWGVGRGDCRGNGAGKGEKEGNEERNAEPTRGVRGASRIKGWVILLIII